MERDREILIYASKKKRTDLRENVAVAVTRSVGGCTNTFVADTNVMRIALIMTWIMAFTGLVRMGGN